MLRSTFYPAPANAGSNDPPPLALLDSAELAETRRRLKARDAALLPAFARLKSDADRALRGEAFSVTRKELLPPSGARNDYLSLAPYWWPDPRTSDGLPFIRRDGEVNPARDRASDRRQLTALIQGVQALGLSYYLTGYEPYASRAAMLLRAWFVEPATKMNPHLRYAQSIPGRSEGRAEGIIEARRLPELLDAVVLLREAKSWTRGDDTSLRVWVNDYLSWLLTSPQGKKAAEAQNNHGSWYDVQAAAVALFAGRRDIAEAILKDLPAKRIARQIASDGRQPGELARTRAWDYSLFNLEALFNAASIGEKIGVDLWREPPSDRGGMRKALDWLIPFATGEARWTYSQLGAFERERIEPLLRRAAHRYRDGAYEGALARLPRLDGTERRQLLYHRSVDADDGS